jgi:hypothetical protein
MFVSNCPEGGRFAASLSWPRAFACLAPEFPKGDPEANIVPRMDCALKQTVNHLHGWEVLNYVNCIDICFHAQGANLLK